MTEEQSKASKFAMFGVATFFIGLFIFAILGFMLGYFIAGIGLAIMTIGELSLAVAFFFYLIGR